MSDKKILNDMTNDGNSTPRRSERKRRSSDKKKEDQTAFVEAELPDGRFLGWSRGRGGGSRGKNSGKAKKGEVQGQRRQLQGIAPHGGLQEHEAGRGALLTEQLLRGRLNSSVSISSASPRRHGSGATLPRHS